MTKKNFVLKVLIRLEKYWIGATQLINAIERDEINSEGYDELYETIKQEIEFVDNEKQRIKLQESSDYLSRVKEMEEIDQQHEEVEIIRIEDIFDKDKGL